MSALRVRCKYCAFEIKKGWVTAFERDSQFSLERVECGFQVSEQQGYGWGESCRSRSRQRASNLDVLEL